MKNGSDVRETPFKCRKTKVSEESSSDDDSTAIFHVTKTKFDANEPEWTKNCIQERNKLDLSPNNEAFDEIAPKMSSKKSSIESSKNRCHESHRRRHESSRRRDDSSRRHDDSSRRRHESSRRRHESSRRRHESSRRCDDSSRRRDESRRCRHERDRRRDRTRSSSEEFSHHCYPQTGSNFSKIPTNLEIPDERINYVASVSSKTQKDTKPIKNN